MNYVKISFVVTGQEQKDCLTALLFEAGYEGFEETDDKLIAYIGQDKFISDDLKDISETIGVVYDREDVAPQNWNALWESNFPPVIVEGFCTIRAHFHDITVTTPYEIQITPKMSFGTGHHATTQLMMRLMQGIDFKVKSVLDFGTGTGVLAILAEKLGAVQIVAIDNDGWCVENAGENVIKNSCEAVQVVQGSLEVAGSFVPDIILANINRHILLHYMTMMYEILAKGGMILMSGLLTDDEAIIKDAALGAGFIFDSMMEQNNWIALKFNKM